VVARVQKSWETGDPWEDTFPLRRHDGVFRWFLSRALPVHDENGDVVRWFGTNTDITEIREAEERRRLLLDELNHRVKNTLASVQSISQMTLRHHVARRVCRQGQCPAAGAVTLARLACARNVAGCLVA